MRAKHLGHTSKFLHGVLRTFIGDKCASCERGEATEVIRRSDRYELYCKPCRLKLFGETPYEKGRRKVDPRQVVMFQEEQ